MRDIVFIEPTALLGHDVDQRAIWNVMIRNGEYRSGWAGNFECVLEPTLLDKYYPNATDAQIVELFESYARAYCGSDIGIRIRHTLDLMNVTTKKLVVDYALKDPDKMDSYVSPGWLLFAMPHFIRTGEVSAKRAYDWYIEMRPYVQLLCALTLEGKLTYLTDYGYVPRLQRWYGDNPHPFAPLTTSMAEKNDYLAVIVQPLLERFYRTRLYVLNQYMALNETSIVNGDIGPGRTTDDLLGTYLYLYDSQNIILRKIQKYRNMRIPGFTHVHASLRIIGSTIAIWFEENSGLKFVESR